jgi:hypothetical protein
MQLQALILALTLGSTTGTASFIAWLAQPKDHSLILMCATSDWWPVFVTLLGVTVTVKACFKIAAAALQAYLYIL